MHDLFNGCWYFIKHSLKHDDLWKHKLSVDACFLVWLAERWVFSTFEPRKPTDKIDWQITDVVYRRLLNSVRSIPRQKLLSIKHFLWKRTIERFPEVQICPERKYQWFNNYLKSEMIEEFDSAYSLKLWNFVVGAITRWDCVTITSLQMTHNIFTLTLYIVAFPSYQLYSKNFYPNQDNCNWAEPLVQTADFTWRRISLFNASAELGRFTARFTPNLIFSTVSKPRNWLSIQNTRNIYRKKVLINKDIYLSFFKPSGIVRLNLIFH